MATSVVRTSSQPTDQTKTKARRQFHWPSWSAIARKVHLPRPQMAPRSALAPFWMGVILLGSAIVYGIAHIASLVGLIMLLGLPALPACIIADEIRRHQDRIARRTKPRSLWPPERRPIAWFLTTLLDGLTVLGLTWLLLRHDVPGVRSILYWAGLVLLLLTPPLGGWYAHQVANHGTRRYYGLPFGTYMAIGFEFLLFIGAYAFYVAYTS